MPRVSVIIPVYNVEAYLRQCLDSVAGQTLDDIEIICVDDGSTDTSAAILAEYAAKDPRFKIISRTHSNAGAARNAGLVAASGTWLAFLDADDAFERAMLAEMADTGDRETADVVACTDRTRGDVFRRWRGWAWDKLFRRAFVERLGLRFQEIPVSNDLLFTYSALVLAERVVPLGKSYVFHRKRPGSVETTRARAPLAPLEAVRALRARVGLAEGFAWWVPDFLFWHVNRLKDRQASDRLYAETERLGRELGIRRTAKWAFEEVKHFIRRMTGRLGTS